MFFQTNNYCRQFCICLLVLLGLAACRQHNDRLIKKQYFIFGTIVEVLVWHDDEKIANLALAQVEAKLNAMHSHWHAWKPGRLQQINTVLRAGGTVALTDEELTFIQTTQKLSQQSLGYFNPAMGELIHLWGFHTDIYPILQPPPDDDDIQKYLQHLPKMDNLLFAGNSLSSSNRRIWLDYGGVAKGYAIDQAIEILQSFGINNAIVNAGGDLRSMGSKGGEAWKVAIRKPNSEDILTVIQVKGDESIFTSGNYERYKEFNGKRYAHIINPNTGYGIEEIASATVIAANGTSADAAATALIVAGGQNWHAVSQSMQLHQVLLIKADGVCLATQQMLDRLPADGLLCRRLE